MLRLTTKEKLISIISLQMQMHRRGIVEQETVSPEVLEECQQAALAVGCRLEKELPDRTDLVEKLEQYCEALYQLSQQPEQKESITAHMNALLAEVKEQIAGTRAVFQAVFMPYKAEMWDSLESVWMAFEKDEDCEALVMPLPYSKYSAEEQKWIPCYEGDRFPEYVPILDYHTYHLEEEYPEFIFIHNAYDEYNRVTRIDQAYFSAELKKYTKNLVYIPYYLTSGFVAEDHKMLSAYRYMDYMIVQSELFKSGFEGAFFYNKVLPLGSPKLDRVIRMCQGEKQIPQEWRKVIGDKKSIMLNTSLGYFLHFGEYYLRKIRCCIDWLKENPIVALIWRPHPLFESTIRSMRPELLPMYQELVEYFLESGIGILDQTPDIARTIAIVDGYIGDSWTSVINLFGAAGRPMFILDASKRRPYTREEQRRVAIAGMVEDEAGKLWIVPLYYNGLLCTDGKWDKVRFVHRFENQPHWSWVQGYVSLQDGMLYLTPLGSVEPVGYQINTGEATALDWEGDGKNLSWKIHYVYKESIFYVSANPQRLGIFEYNRKERSWTVHMECMKGFLNKGESFSKEPCISGTDSDGRYIWITAIYTNQILQFDMKTGNYTYEPMGAERNGYSDICLSGNVLYLAEMHGDGTLLEVNKETGVYKEYPLPKVSHNTWRSLYQVEFAIGQILDMGKYLILLPGYSKRMWRFEKETGEFLSLAEEFWEEAARETEDFLPMYTAIWIIAKIKQGTTVWVQRRKDDAILILDVETGDYKVKYMYLSEEDFEELTNAEDGFQKAQIDSPFVQSESRYFQFSDFIKKIANGELKEVKRRQLEELKTLAVNMDGTCGEKVHDYLCGMQK